MRFEMTEAPGTHNPQFLPPDIPVPQDDGAASHLTGMRLPDLALPATDGPPVNLSNLKGRTVVYVYPRTGVPGVDPPDGWGQIPGARGCTPHSCSFRDHFEELRRLGVAQLFWPVHARHRLSAGGGEPPASAVPHPFGSGSRVCQGA